MKSARKEPLTASRRLLTPRGAKPGQRLQSPNFEDSERSTLPSAVSTARQLLHSPKVLQSLSQDQCPIKRELEDLTMLQSLLLQWHFANACAERTEGRFTRRVEEEVYDRGVQLVQLQEEVETEKSRLKAVLQQKLLDEALGMEVETLQSNEDDILKTAEYLIEVQAATKGAITRVPLAGDAEALYESLVTADHSLERVYGLVEGEQSGTEALVEPCHRLAEAVSEEREEIINSHFLLSTLRKLYEEEKEAIAATAQKESS